MVRTSGRPFHERVHAASEWTNAFGLREFLRPYPRDRSWPTWPLGRVASGGSTQADHAQMAGVERDQDPRGLGMDHRVRTQAVGPRADPAGWLRGAYQNCGHAP